jgi:hypothetical protein
MSEGERRRIKFGTLKQPIESTKEAGRERNNKGVTKTSKGRKTSINRKERKRKTDEKRNSSVLRFFNPSWKTREGKEEAKRRQGRVCQSRVSFSKGIEE